eukprot:4152063-Amphidinium_carterae.2
MLHAGDKTCSDITDSQEALEFLCKQFPLLSDRLREEPEAAAQFVAQQPSRPALCWQTCHHITIVGHAQHY